MLLHAFIRFGNLWTYETKYKQIQKKSSYALNGVAVPFALKYCLNHHTQWKNKWPENLQYYRERQIRLPGRKSAQNMRENRLILLHNRGNLTFSAIWQARSRLSLIFSLCAGCENDKTKQNKTDNILLCHFRIIWAQKTIFFSVQYLFFCLF